MVGTFLTGARGFRSPLFERLVAVLAVIAILFVLLPTAVLAQDKEPAPPDDGGIGQVDCDNLGLGDDNSEPNDNDLEATVLTSGITLTDRTVCNGDDDWFTMSLSAGALLTVDVSFVDANGDIDVEVFDAAGSRLTAGASSSDNETVSVVTPNSGFYFARVTMFGNATNDYDITMTASCRDDDFEPNNTQATAALLTPGVQVSGQTCAGPDQDDYFSFEVAAGDIIDVDLLFTEADGNLDLALFNESGATEITEQSLTDNEAIADYVADSAGSWAVQVIPVNASENSYDLTVSVASPCPEDSFESNNTNATAAPITPGVQISGQSCAGPDEIDYFSFDVTAGDIIDVDLVFTHADGNLDLALFNESDGPETGADSISDNETIASFVANSTGTWTVAVIPFGDAENSYDLTVTSGAPSCVDDTFEPNNTAATATPLTPGVQISGHTCAGPNQDDYFTFPVAAGQLIDVNLDFAHATANLDLALYNENGVVQAIATSDTDNETIDSFVATSTGIWTVLVNPIDEPENSFDLTVTVTACPDDDLEQNNTSGTATPITSGSQVSGQTCAGANEDDYFSFEVTAGDIIDVDLNFTHANGNLNLWLYDENGTTRTQSFSSTDNETIDNVVATSSGTWTLHIDPVDSDTANSYDLTVTVTAPPCVDDDNEPNNTNAAATPIASGVQVQGQTCVGAGQDDWFSFDVSAGQLINVDLDFTHANGNLDLLLYFDGISTPATQSATPTDNETIDGHLATSTGTWFVWVEPGQGVENSYDLTVTVSEACHGLEVTIDMNLNGGNGDGTPDADVILGTPGDDIINGFDGDDTICGGNGADTINGGNGNDLISGQGDNDLLFGNDGEDRINGGNGDDEIHGGNGDDDLRGQGGNDVMFGDDGIDQFFGGPGNDTIETGTGGNLGTTKVVRGGGNNDTITGSPDADQLEGGAGEDIINGGGGDDIINGGTGNDDLFGDDGVDTLNGQGNTDTCDGGTGTDTATISCETQIGVP